MNEQSHHNDSLPPAPAEQDVAALIKKMQQQMVLLEKREGLIQKRSRFLTGEKAASFRKASVNYGRIVI